MNISCVGSHKPTNYLLFQCIVHILWVMVIFWFECVKCGIHYKVWLEENMWESWKILYNYGWYFLLNYQWLLNDWLFTVEFLRSHQFLSSMNFTHVLVMWKMKAINYLYKVCSIFKMACYVVHKPLFLVCLQDLSPEERGLTKIVLIWGVVPEITLGLLFSKDMWYGFASKIFNF
jgi:hypothetical protein